VTVHVVFKDFGSVPHRFEFDRPALDKALQDLSAENLNPHLLSGGS
jgi:hypothetical protein